MVSVSGPGLATWRLTSSRAMYQSPIPAPTDIRAFSTDRVFRLPGGYEVEAITPLLNPRAKPAPDMMSCLDSRRRSPSNKGVRTSNITESDNGALASMRPPRRSKIPAYFPKNGRRSLCGLEVEVGIGHCDTKPVPAIGLANQSAAKLRPGYNSAQLTRPSRRRGALGVNPSEWSKRRGKIDTLCWPQSEKAHEVPRSISSAFDAVNLQLCQDIRNGVIGRRDAQ
jgi:hypothetical protein